MSVTLDCTQFLHVENSKLSSDGGSCGSKKCKRDYGEVWRSLRLPGVRSLKSVCRFCVGAFGISIEDFSHLVYFIKKFYKRCTFNTVFKGNAGINYTSVRHKSGSFRSNLTGQTTLVLSVHISLDLILHVGKSKVVMLSPCRCQEGGKI